MNQHTYPRAMDMNVFIRWYNGGDSLFLGKERKPTLTAFKDLVDRMSLPLEYEEMRQETFAASSTRGHGARYGYGPCPDFRRGVADALRLCGYVYYSAPGASLMDRVPLEPQQVHLVRLLASGYSTEEMAQTLGSTAKNIRWRMVTLRRELGCATTAQAIASVYQNRWLPTLTEERTLIRQGAPVVPGMITHFTDQVPACA